MTPLRTCAEEYLTLRRRLGFKLTSQGPLLLDFIGYLERSGQDHITTEAALSWAMATPSSTSEIWWSRRLMVVRIFARHLKPLQAATEIPPDDVLPHHKCRRTPYLYSPDEITALITAAGALTPQLRAWTYRTLICLLAATGMRVGEACRLDQGDVDLATGILAVRDSKFGKSRQIPLHPTTTAALEEYDRRRDQWHPTPGTVAFFVSTRGTRLSSHNVPHVFGPLLHSAGIHAAPGRRPPRMHDLRHSFAIATLRDWYADGGDVQARLPLLSTYLGHADPKSTYWYLSGAPELLALAATRLEHALGGQP
jgi:integrase